MVRTVLIALFFASPVLGQNSRVTAVVAAGCGPNEVHFQVKTDKKKHPTAEPDPGKALIYVIEDSAFDHVAIHTRTPPRRFGVDGEWVGANGYRSYFHFPVEPGDHRLCAEIQSRIQGAVHSSLAATSFTAEAGKTYYFRTKTPNSESSSAALQIVPVDPPEAQILLATAAFSTFHLMK
jgi:hypothetical protein